MAWRDLGAQVADLFDGVQVDATARLEARWSDMRARGRSLRRLAFNPPIAATAGLPVVVRPAVSYAPEAVRRRAQRRRERTAILAARALMPVPRWPPPRPPPLTRQAVRRRSGHQTQ